MSNIDGLNESALSVFPISEFFSEVDLKNHIPLEGSSDTFAKLRAENLSLARMQRDIFISIGRKYYVLVIGHHLGIVTK